MTAESSEVVVAKTGKKRKREISNENLPNLETDLKKENTSGPSPKKKKNINLDSSENIDISAIEQQTTPDLNKKRKRKKRKNLSEPNNIIESNDAREAVNTTKGFNDVPVPKLCKIEVSSQTLPISRRKKRKRKSHIEINKIKDTNDIKPVDSQIDCTNDLNVNSTDAEDSKTVEQEHNDIINNDTKINQNSPSVASESNSPRKKKRKNKKKLAITDDQNQPDGSSENNQTQDEKVALSKPLKSSLKKKKKKKKNKNKLSTESTGDSNDSNSNVKKLTWKKSVTFDENVQVELIDSCLSKSPDEKTKLSNERKKEKALAYLRRWKDDKSNWKFEKLTQMWLLKQMYHENMVPSDVFPDLLEYLVNLKGASKELVVKLSQQIIAKMEKKTPEENDEELETAYSRARSVLQHLQ